VTTARLPDTALTSPTREAVERELLAEKPLHTTLGQVAVERTRAITDPLVTDSGAAALAEVFGRSRCPVRGCYEHQDLASLVGARALSMTGRIGVSCRYLGSRRWLSRYVTHHRPFCPYVKNRGAGDHDQDGQPDSVCRPACSGQTARALPECSSKHHVEG
jgi:hypothetical protein